MDKISGLPDDVLVKILSYVPTKEAVSTSIMSKRWKFVWMWLPRLEFISDNEPVPAMCDFINKKLPLHRAATIERLHLRFGYSRFIPRDVKRWVEIAVSRHVRDLKISYFPRDENVFPSSIFTCKSLVILKLKHVSLMDAPSTVCLPSLKTLQLKQVIIENEKAFQRLLSNCPLLEDLLVDGESCYDDADNIKVLAVIIPSLKRLSLFLPDNWPLDGYVIDTPSLKFLKLEDLNIEDHYSVIKNMPVLREAFVDTRESNLQSVLGSITSVKRLTLCCVTEDVYGGGCVFNQLEHLKLCVCKENSSMLLGPLLNDSPNLRELECFLEDGHFVDEPDDDMVCLNQSSSVPDCLVSSLQIFKWSRYLRRPQDRDIAVYILKNARHLKTATILTNTRRDFFHHIQMTTELTSPGDLTLYPRASATCQLILAEELN